MRRMLQIGEVAQLLGITTKTIRHYHKVGLLPEPERSATGYRLYSADDLARLRQIRQLQSFGLSLKYIKVVLGEPAEEILSSRTLRTLLLTLDTELTAQIHVLEERRARIRTLLADEIDDSSPTFEMVKTLFGERLAAIDPALMRIEKKLWETVDIYHWPVEYREHLLRLAELISSRPDLYEHMLALGQKIASLATLSLDAPELQQLLNEARHDVELLNFIRELQQLTAQLPAMPAVFSATFGDLLTQEMTPAQVYFMQELQRHLEQPEVSQRERLRILEDAEIGL